MHICNIQMKHMQHQMEHTSETHENIRSSMPWSDEKIWASTQLPTVNRHGSSKWCMQMWAHASLTNSQAPWPALQVPRLLSRSAKATMR